MALTCTSRRFWNKRVAATCPFSAILLPMRVRTGTWSFPAHRSHAPVFLLRANEMLCFVTYGSTTSSSTSAMADRTDALFSMPTWCLPREILPPGAPSSASPIIRGAHSTMWLASWERSWQQRRCDLDDRRTLPGRRPSNPNNFSDWHERIALVPQ